MLILQHAIVVNRLQVSDPHFLEYVLYCAQEYGYDHSGYYSVLTVELINYLSQILFLAFCPPPASIHINIAQAHVEG